MLLGRVGLTFVMKITDSVTVYIETQEQSVAVLYHLH